MGWGKKRIWWLTLFLVCGLSRVTWLSGHSGVVTFKLLIACSPFGLSGAGRACRNDTRVSRNILSIGSWSFLFKLDRLSCLLVSDRGTSRASHRQIMLSTYCFFLMQFTQDCMTRLMTPVFTKLPRTRSQAGPL